MLRQQPAVNEDRVPDDEDHGIGGKEPPGDRPFGAQGGNPGAESRMEFRPNSGEFVRDSTENVSGGFDSIAEGFHGISDLEPIGPDLELAEGGGGDKLEVALDVHDLVVSEEGEEGAAGAVGVDLEAVEEVEELELVGAAVEDVTDLDGDGVAAGPSEGATVDDSGEGEGLEGLFEVSVQVADGEEAGRGRVVGLEGRRGVFRVRVLREEEAGDGEVDECVDEGGEMERNFSAERRRRRRRVFCHFCVFWSLSALFDKARGLLYKKRV